MRNPEKTIRNKDEKPDRGTEIMLLIHCHHPKHSGCRKMFGFGDFRREREALIYRRVSRR